MTLKRIIMIAIFLGAGLAQGADQPYLVQAKVLSDLEAALSRVIPQGKYLIQVDADVATKTEKRLVEGETVVSGPEAEEEAEPQKEIMPGFLPEPSAVKKKPERNSQNREVFRTVESPILNLIRVVVTFDEKLDALIVTKARLMITNFLTAAYPNKFTLTFNQIPMLKTREEIEKEKEEEIQRKLASQPPTPTPVPEKEADKEPIKEEEPWKEYLPWAAAGLLGLILLVVLLTQRRGSNAPSAQQGQWQPPQSQWAQPAGFGQHPSQGPFDARGHFSERRRRRAKDFEKDESPKANVISYEFNEHRRDFLETIFAQSDTYRLYFQSLNAEKQGELFSLLKGPAYEKFLDGMGLKKPAEEPQEPQDMEETLQDHEKNFREFCKAKEWQDRQFFGFLQRLNEEQIMNLVHHEDPFAVCVMLRFMKPNQSALVLDALPQEKRVEVLRHVDGVQSTSFVELAHLEQNIRTSVEKLPEHFFGSKKEDIGYWSKVLDEAQDQDGILHDLEYTQPGIFPDLKKTRFKLDEALNIDPNILKKVMGEADNEELALALMSTNPQVQSALLARMSPRRRALLEEQLATARGASKDQIVEARLKLTKRFREAIG